MVIPSGSYALACSSLFYSIHHSYVQVGVLVHYNLTGKCEETLPQLLAAVVPDIICVFLHSRGEYALQEYTEVKAVTIKVSQKN